MSICIGKKLTLTNYFIMSFFVNRFSQKNRAHKCGRGKIIFYSYLFLLFLAFFLGLAFFFGLAFFVVFFFAFFLAIFLKNF